MFGTWYGYGKPRFKGLTFANRFARCRDIDEKEFRVQVADWAFVHGYEKFNKEDANKLKSVHKQKEWEKIRSKQHQQKVKEQYIHISDDYLRSLLAIWGLEKALSIPDFKRSIIENEDLVEGHIDFEGENLEWYAKWASRGTFNASRLVG